MGVSAFFKLQFLLLPLLALYFMLRLSETVIQRDLETVHIIAINKNRREFLSIVTFSTNGLQKPTENKSKRNKGVLHRVHTFQSHRLGTVLSCHGVVCRCFVSSSKITVWNHTFLKPVALLAVRTSWRELPATLGQVLPSTFYQH